MIRIGLIGAGGMGTVHKSNYDHIEGCEVVALVGNAMADSKKAIEWEIPIYTSIEDMVSNAKPDVVDICLPTFLHKEFALAAISHGLHVIVEKPIALSAKDAKDIYDRARKKGVLVFVGQIVRFFKEYQVLADMIKSKCYGEVLDVRFERLAACPKWAQGGWLFDKKKSGLVPYDLHIHDLDFIISVFGKPKKMDFTSVGNKKADYKEHYRFSYSYDDFNVSIEAAWFNAEYPFSTKWQVYFENAVVTYDGIAVTAYQQGKEAKQFDISEKIKIPTGINLPPTGVFLEELAHFIECIKNGVASNIIIEDQILSVMEILEGIASLEEQH